MGWITFQFYRWILFPLALFSIRSSHWFLSKKMKQMLDQRKEPSRIHFNNRPIWIHASSGEVEYAKPVIRAIKYQWPERNVLLTYFSPSAMPLTQKLPVDAVIPLPWDDRKSVKLFLDHFQPLLALFSRTDVWPEFAYQLKRKKIPSLLFSANMNTTRKKAALSQFAVQRLTAIYDVQNYGDTRYDQVIYRLNNPHHIKTELYPKSKKVLVAGSTWPEDEKILFASLDEFVRLGGQVILAPHDIQPSRIEKIKNELTRLGFTHCLYSEAHHFDSQILIINQVGVLAELYAWGQVAFVGGSFKKLVHSVMEPLAAGLTVVLGPHYKNNPEAIEFNKIFISPAHQAVNVVHNSAEMQKLIQDWPCDKTVIQSEVQKRTGATKKVMNWVIQHLPENGA